MSQMMEHLAVERPSTHVLSPHHVRVLGQHTESAERWPSTASSGGEENIVLAEAMASGPLPPPAYESICKHRSQWTTRSNAVPISWLISGYRVVKLPVVKKRDSGCSFDDHRAITGRISAHWDMARQQRWRLAASQHAWQLRSRRCRAGNWSWRWCRHCFPETSAMFSAVATDVSNARGHWCSTYHL